MSSTKTAGQRMREKGFKRIEVYVPKEKHSLFLIKCRQRGRSMSDVINELVSAYIHTDDTELKELIQQATEADVETLKSRLIAEQSSKGFSQRFDEIRAGTLALIEKVKKEEGSWKYDRENCKKCTDEKSCKACVQKGQALNDLLMWLQKLQTDVQGFPVKVQLHRSIFLLELKLQELMGDFNLNQRMKETFEKMADAKVRGPRLLYLRLKAEVDMIKEFARGTW